MQFIFCLLPRVVSFFNGNLSNKLFSYTSKLQSIGTQYIFERIFRGEIFCKKNVAGTKLNMNSIYYLKV